MPLRWIFWCRCKRAVLISITFKLYIWHVDYLAHVGAEGDAVVSQKPILLIARWIQSLISWKFLLLYLPLSNWRVSRPLVQSTYIEVMKSCAVERNSTSILGSLSFHPIHLRDVLECSTESWWFFWRNWMENQWTYSLSLGHCHLSGLLPLLEQSASPDLSAGLYELSLIWLTNTQLF